MHFSANGGGNVLIIKLLQDIIQKPGSMEPKNTGNKNNGCELFAAVDVRGIGNREPETGNRDWATRNRKPGTEIGQPGTRNRKPRLGDQEPETGTTLPLHLGHCSACH